MTDHITRVREQAEREAGRLWPIPPTDAPWTQVVALGNLRDGYVRGQGELASRLTREKIAIALAKKITPRWDELPGEMHLALIHAKYGEADAILDLMVEGVS